MPENMPSESTAVDGDSPLVVEPDQGADRTDAPRLLPGEVTETGMGHAFAGEAGQRRVAYTRHRLDDALEQWWRLDLLPTKSLLRDSLLTLEAGHDLDESHHALLLRTALRHNRGTLTALRYQTDPERTAIVVQETILDLDYPFESDLFAQMVEQDAQSHEWAPLLAVLLAAPAIEPHHPAQVRAVEALSVLHGAIAQTGAEIFVPPIADQQEESDVAFRRRALVMVLLPLLVIVASVVAWLTLRDQTQEMVEIPAATYYAISDPAMPGAERLVTTQGFWLDHTEVTNRAYRQCVQEGACSPPARNDSASRAAYFSEPTYDDYPVVHVSWSAASTFCRWREARLPTEEEWQIAASVAPATQRHYAYPWGDFFEVALSNNLLTGNEDTQQTGRYSPVGDSPFGARDMAGNVAEWTATSAQSAADHYVIKGGSYQDTSDQLRVTARRDLNGNADAPWLGFRCVSGLKVESEGKDGG